MRKCPQPGGLVNVKASSSWHAIDSPPHATPGRLRSPSYLRVSAPVPRDVAALSGRWQGPPDACPVATPSRLERLGVTP
eukprot:scaffold3255_cov278-Prasinococcus_capsulatus_cf.AAC.1